MAVTAERGRKRWEEGQRSGESASEGGFAGARRAPEEQRGERAAGDAAEEGRRREEMVLAEYVVDVGRAYAFRERGEGGRRWFEAFGGVGFCEDEAVEVGLGGRRWRRMRGLRGVSEDPVGGCFDGRVGRSGGEGLRNEFFREAHAKKLLHLLLEVCWICC